MILDDGDDAGDADDRSNERLVKAFENAVVVVFADCNRSCGCKFLNGNEKRKNNLETNGKRRQIKSLDGFEQKKKKEKEE